VWLFKLLVSVVNADCKPVILSITWASVAPTNICASNKLSIVVNVEFIKPKSDYYSLSSNAVCKPVMWLIAWFAAVPAMWRIKSKLGVTIKLPYDSGIHYEPSYCSILPNLVVFCYIV
jgi:hypothetical protein